MEFIDWMRLKGERKKRGKWSIAVISNHYFSKELWNAARKKNWLSILSVFFFFYKKHITNWTQLDTNGIERMAPTCIQLNHWNQNQWLLNIQRPLINSVWIHRLYKSAAKLIIYETFKQTSFSIWDSFRLKTCHDNDKYLNFVHVHRHWIGSLRCLATTLCLSKYSHRFVWLESFIIATKYSNASSDKFTK